MPLLWPAHAQGADTSDPCPGKEVFGILSGVWLFSEATKAHGRTPVPGSTLGAKPSKAGCYSACLFHAKSFLELAASNLCKTSYIIALQSQSPACPMDLIPSGSLVFHFT